MNVKIRYDNTETDTPFEIKSMLESIPMKSINASIYCIDFSNTIVFEADVENKTPFSEIVFMHSNGMVGFCLEFLGIPENQKRKVVKLFEKNGCQPVNQKGW